MTIKLRSIVRNRKVYSKINNKFSNETLGGGIRVLIEYHNRNVIGPMKIKKDIIERVNPFAIADLLPFFIKFQIFNEKKPMQKQTIKSIKNIDKHVRANSVSTIGPERETAAIRKIKAKIASKKKITPENKYNHSNFVIIFGFSSILYSLYEKYYLTGIDFFGDSNKKSKEEHHRCNTTKITPLYVTEPQSHRKIYKNMLVFCPIPISPYQRV